MQFSLLIKGYFKLEIIICTLIIQLVGQFVGQLVARPYGGNIFCHAFIHSKIEFVLK